MKLDRLQGKKELLQRIAEMNQDYLEDEYELMLDERWDDYSDFYYDKSDYDDYCDNHLDHDDYSDDNLSCYDYVDYDYDMIDDDFFRYQRERHLPGKYYRHKPTGDFIFVTENHNNKLCYWFVKTGKEYLGPLFELEGEL